MPTTTSMSRAWPSLRAITSIWPGELTSGRFTGLSCTTSPPQLSSIPSATQRRIRLWRESWRPPTGHTYSWASSSANFLPQAAPPTKHSPQTPLGRGTGTPGIALAFCSCTICPSHLQSDTADSRARGCRGDGRHQGWITGSSTQALGHSGLAVCTLWRNSRGDLRLDRLLGVVVIERILWLRLYERRRLISLRTHLQCSAVNNTIQIRCQHVRLCAAQSTDGSHAAGLGHMP